MTTKKRGGWTNAAAAENGKAGGRTRKPAREIAGHPSFVLRDGDTVSIAGDGGLTLATATIVLGALRLTSDDGRVLTIVISE